MKNTFDRETPPHPTPYCLRGYFGEHSSSSIDADQPCAIPISQHTSSKVFKPSLSEST